MFNRKVVICLVIFVLVPLIMLVLRFGVGGWSARSLTVSPQTTVIEGLGPDGYPDYIAALNAEMSEGVTPENNSAVLLIQAMGPPDLPREMQGEFYKKLGVKPSSEAKYFVDWPVYCKSIPPEEQAKIVPATAEDSFQLLIDMQEEAGERPWSREEFPHLATWLDENAGPIELMVKASRLPKYYAPLISAQDEPMVASILLPLLQQSRSAAAHGYASHAAIEGEELSGCLAGLDGLPPLGPFSGRGRIPGRCIGWSRDRGNWRRRADSVCCGSKSNGRRMGRFANGYGCLAVPPRPS